jgi:hypothetical protein
MSQANLPFITLRMTPNEFHQQVPILLDYARTKGLYDYVVGNDIVKTQDQLNSQNQSKMSIYCTILEAQMVEQEAAHAAMVLKRLNTNPLYAYMYNSPITAADPLRPTQLEIDNSREVILYNQESYEEYLGTIGELIKPAGSAARATQCSSIRPSQKFIGFGGIIDQETVDAANVVRIRKFEYDDIADTESRITPTIQRYHASTDLTDLDIYLKLTPANRSLAVDKYTQSNKTFEKERTRVLALNASLLTLFKDCIEGVGNSSAAQYLKNEQWDKVLEEISKAYGGINSPPAAESLQASFTSIVMGANDNVYTFMDKFQSLLANIHVTFEAIEEMPQAERLSFAQVYQGCLLTTAKWNTMHPNNPTFTNHLTVLLRLLSAITDTRLHQVVYDFNTKFTTKDERTVEKLVACMHIGEAALPLNEQVSHQMSNHQVATVTTSNGNSANPTAPKFCAYHSYGNNASTHSTADCKTIAKGLTKRDPTSSQWHVMKDTGAHYVARPASSNASNASGNKRSNASNDKKSSKKANTNGGMCTNCVKLNAGGESIPEYVMKNHSADTCRIKKKSSSGSNSSTSSAKAPQQSGLPFTSEQIGQIALVYQTLHTIGSANTGKKSKDASSEGSS